MAYIKLIKLTVTGENKTESSIDFGKKVTIIAGPSDSGKSCIFRCIDYALGASNKEENIPLDPIDGYDTITLYLETHKGLITLKRKNYATKIEVITTIDGIDSGEYSLKPQKKTPNNINELFLKLFDLPTELTLPSDEDGVPATFSWRTLIKAFVIDEHRADKSKSILLPTNGQSLFIASLIYFLTNNELAEYKNDKEGETIKKAKKNAIISYIKNNKTELETEKNKFESQLSLLTNDGKSIEDKIQELNDILLKTNEIIDNITLESQKITMEILEVQNRLSNTRVLLSKYEGLQSQYNTDIARLSFIVENESVIKQKKRKTKCPFCDSEITPHDHSSYIEASQAELVKVINNNNELEDERIELLDSISDDEALIADYLETLEELKNKLNNELLPQRNEITAIMSGYANYNHIKGILEYINQFESTMDKEIEKYEAINTKTDMPFKGKELLFELLKDVIPVYAKEILLAVGYENVETVTFDPKTLDLVINNKRKLNRGKGYKAFTNSVLLLAFQKFVTIHSQKNISMYFFDSPLKNLELPEGLNETLDIRKGYFQYLIDLNTSDQIIVIENTKYHELPELETNEDTKIYKFTQKDGEGRYGFLMDVRKA